MPRKRTGRSRGAPRGNRNALKTGAYTRESRLFRQSVRRQLGQAKALIAAVLPLQPSPPGRASSREPDDDVS